jgi:hypothetical protein
MTAHADDMALAPGRSWTRSGLKTGVCGVGPGTVRL